MNYTKKTRNINFQSKCVEISIIVCSHWAHILNLRHSSVQIHLFPTRVFEQKKQKHVKCVYINAGGKKERADIRTFCFSESLAARFQQASLIAVVWDWERFPSFPRETHFRSILCNLQQFCIWTQMLQIGEGVFFISFCFSIFLYSGLCSQGFCRNIFCCHATYWQHIKCSNCLTE